MTEPGTETVAYKQSILRGLGNVIGMNRSRALSPKTQQRIDIIQNDLQKDLAALLERSQHEEVDLKLAAFKKVLAILKE